MNKAVFSRVTTWAIRILLFMVVVIGIGMFALSKLAGTSESHRIGLEQGFSDFLQADVKITRIDEFNIIPQLSIKVSDVHGVSKDTQDEFLIDNIYLAFGFMDLMTGRRRIEGFEINNFRFSSDSKYDLRIDHAAIDAKASAFKIEGQFTQRDFSFIVPLGKNPDGRASYYVVEKSDIAGDYGSLDIKGAFVSSSDPKAHIADFAVTSLGKPVATGYGLRENSDFKIVFDCDGKNVPAKAKSDFKNLETLSFMNIGENCTK